MKFEYINDVKGFFDTIDKCRKNVYVVTTEATV